MPQQSYTYACARISALEPTIFKQEDIRKLAESSLEDVMRALMDARYGNLPDATAADCEKMIENERLRATRELRELSPLPAVTDLFLLRTDVQNLKMLLKARLLGSHDVVCQEGGVFTKEQLTQAVAEQDYRALPETFKNALDRLESKLKITPEPQLISITLDRAYLLDCQQTAKAQKADYLKEYVETMCDFTNVLTFLRMRAMGAAKEELREALLPEGGIKRSALLDAYDLASDALEHIVAASRASRALEAGLAEMVRTGNIGAVEKAEDNALLHIIKQHKHEVQTIYPIIGYLMAREREAKAIRLIVTVKRNGLDDAVIAERLCELYG